jgi:hypothetical protein
VGQLQCPVCYSPLEVRDVASCFVCGGWPESVARLDPTADFAEYRLPDGQPLVLCRSCQLEEFMAPGGWGYRLLPTEKLPANALHRVRGIASPRVGRDKFCASCNLRLAFLSVVAESQTRA